jgi:hypothetical protein
MKTSFYLAGTVCAASLAFCMLLNAQVSPTITASPAASPATSPSRPLPFRGKITAVDQNAKTVTVGPLVKEWESLVLKITDTTTITKGDAPGTMSDIVVNEQARGAYVERADGTLEAKTLRVGR